MSIELRDMDDGVRPDASQLLVRAASANARAERRLAVAIDDFLLPDDSRLDDHLRVAIADVLAKVVGTVEAALRQHGARLLASRGEPELAEALGNPACPMLDRLTMTGLPRDADLMRELIGRVREDVLAQALPTAAPDDPERPSLLARLSTHEDGVVAAAAMALLGAESRRRGIAGDNRSTQTDLPADLHYRIVWWVAAALREALTAQADDALPVLDRALVEAAQRNLGAHDEGDRLEAAAMKLAAAIDAHNDELPDLLVEALADRRVAMFVALIAQALGFEYGQAREIVLDPAADQLWLLLRALELDHDAVAQIGLALSEGDPRRDIESFADRLDDIMAISVEAARAAVAPLRLHPDYRAAILALARVQPA